MIEDEIVEEVQRIRQRMLAEHNGDMHALVQAAEQFEIDPSIAAKPFVLEDLGEDWAGSNENPIVEEVHRIRAEMLAEQGGDVSALIRQMEHRTEESAAAGRTVVTLPPRKVAQSGSDKKVG
jgi:hypothetical protein